MAKQTSANMQPCKGGAAERHNRREKELDYIRKDLSHLNCYKQWKSISEQMYIIRSEYEKTTGQKLQSSSQPIQEIVLVIDKDTSPAQVEKFCELTKQLGMTPLSYAIHKDEGHRVAENGEWVPNYHAHIIVDTTCWEHKMVERTKKKNGKAIIDPKTKKPVKILVDAYAKTIKFTRLDMSKLQDYAAEATGLERGISSDRIHEEARQYKAREQAREIERMAKEIESQKSQLMTQEKELANQKALLANQVSSIERHSAIIEKQANTIISQRIFIENQEKVMRDSVCEMQKQGKEVVTNFDEQTSKIRSIGLTIDRGLMERRNWLDRTSKENYAEAPSSKIIQILQPLANAITVVAMGAAAMASTIANTLAKTVKEKEKMLFAITRQIKEQSIWKSTKGAILSLIDMPANKQVKELMSEVESVKAEAEKKAQIVNELEIKLSSLNEENQRKSSAINKFTSSIERNAIEKQTLQNRINELQRTLRDKEETIRCWNKDFVSIAEDLVEHAGPKLMERYEARGLHKYIGENLWQRAKEAKELRREEREEQAEPKGRSYGLHL